MPKDKFSTIQETVLNSSNQYVTINSLIFSGQYRRLQDPHRNIHTYDFRDYGLKKEFSGFKDSRKGVLKRAKIQFKSDINRNEKREAIEQAFDSVGL